MSEARSIVEKLNEEGLAARAHFQIWWALRHLALPDFYDAMNNSSYVNFFHASNAGHYKLFFLALSKIFDRDARTSGISNLREVLRSEGHYSIADQLEKRLSPLTTVVVRLMAIRDQTIVHNDRSLPREKVYEINGITPDQIRDLINDTCATINEVAHGLGLTEGLFDDHYDRATIAMLETLRRGKT
jgi:hypothetical protein